MPTSPITIRSALTRSANSPNAAAGSPSTTSLHAPTPAAFTRPRVSLTASSAASFEPALPSNAETTTSCPPVALREHRRGVLGDPSSHGTVGAEEDSLKHDQVVHVPRSYQTGCKIIR